jgi:hypothetical protein
MPDPQTLLRAREIAQQYTPGQVYHLDNTYLHTTFSLARVTTRSRGDIADALRQAGLEILSDPRHEPLIVRRPTARAAGAVAQRTPDTRPWHAKKRSWAAAAAVLLLIIAAATGSDSTKHPVQQAADTITAETSSGPTATTATATTEPVAFTRVAAVQDISDDHYNAAIAAAHHADDRNWVRHRISRRIAYRVQAALHAGNRRQARFLLAKAARYPATPAIAKVRGAYTAAQQRAVARAAARRAARQQAAAARAARRAARAAARRAKQQQAAALAATPDTSSSSDSGGGSYAGMNCDEIGHSFNVIPGSDPEHDRDNDGLACESQ